MKLEIEQNTVTPNGLGMRVRGGGLGTSGWVAKITGKDQKFGFARSFCKKEKDLSGSGKSGSIVFAFDGEGVYEFRNLCYNSQREFSGFLFVSEDEILEIEKDEIEDYLS